MEIPNSDRINFYDDKCEIDCVFNQKGKYKVIIYGNNQRDGEDNNDILQYIVMVDMNASKQLSFPTTCQGIEDINIIEPKYNNIKSGERVKFKIKSNLDEIVIKDLERHHMNKNSSGYFELEKVIQSQPGSVVSVEKKDPDDPDSYSCLAYYDVV